MLVKKFSPLLQCSEQPVTGSDESTLQSHDSFEVRSFLILTFHLHNLTLSVLFFFAGYNYERIQITFLICDSLTPSYVTPSPHHNLLDVIIPVTYRKVYEFRSFSLIPVLLFYLHLRSQSFPYHRALKRGEWPSISLHYGIKLRTETS